MADVFSKEKRSDIMSRIRGHGNKETELVMARLFRQSGIKGWRRHLPVFGNPDFVFRPARVAVFVDGCFWHGCPKHANMPATHRNFWHDKLEANKVRDRKVNRTLRNQGWRVVRIWAHDLRREQFCISRVKSALAKSRTAKP